VLPFVPAIVLAALLQPQESDWTRAAQLSRQLNSWWGCLGTFQAATGKGGWGPMKRKAFTS
jgi:hypothetical protein